MIRPSRNRTRLVMATIAATVLVAGCSNDGERATPPALDVDLVAALQPFDACDDFLAYVKEQAAERVGAYGLDGGGFRYEGDMVPISGMAEDSAARSDVGGVPAPAAKSSSESSPATTAAQMPAANSTAGTDGTGTNNQEAGVDEADIVKTDGNRIVTLRGNQLIVVTMADGAPSVTARLDLGAAFSGDRLFLLGDRAYVLGYDSGPIDQQDATSSYYAGSAGIVEVSLAGEPTVAHRTVVDGSILDGRLANGTLRLVLSTPGGTGLGFVYPDGGAKSEERAETTNKGIVEESTIEDWVPSASLDGGDRAPLLDCDRLYRPAEMSGFSMLSILTISDGLGSLTGSGVLADGGTTYASDDHLYVATNRWDDAIPTGATAKRAPDAVSEHTDVHSFSISGNDPAAYEASGRVEGHVLNQYSMSQSGDDLRIATTVNPTRGGVIEPMPMPVEDCPPDANCTSAGNAGSDAPASSTAGGEPAQQGDSRIVVLRRDGDTLKEVGKVGGLGVTEQIKSVRYVGDVAYVVTFRQTDPFYVVDLSDATAPKVMGELKVPGFSSYLHPVGDQLVLGVGSDATDEGRITGGKLSLYDTSDPVAPKELANLLLPLEYTVTYDSHAFTWDAERQTAYLPYQTSTCGGFGVMADCSSYSFTSGVLVVKVADGAITEVGRITHDDRTPSVPVPPTTVPETTVPETTLPETSVPETTVPSTTVPDTTTTTVAVTETTIAGDSARSSGASAPSIGATEPAPMPVDPGIGCDPAACDPMPLPSPAPYEMKPVITRVFILGDRVITLSDAGIAAHTVDGLQLTGFAAF